MYNRYLDADLDGENDTFDKSAFDRNYLAAGNSVEVSGRAWSPSGLWYGYTGRQLDPETGLMHYRARAYHPTLKQFTRRDPLLYVLGADLYSYVSANPLVLVDPMGLGDTSGGANTASVAGNIAAARAALSEALRQLATPPPTVAKLRAAREAARAFVNVLETVAPGYSGKALLARLDALIDAIWAEVSSGSAATAAELASGTSSAIKDLTEPDPQGLPLPPSWVPGLNSPPPGQGLEPNPHRPGSWGKYDGPPGKDGKPTFREWWRFDKGEPGKPGWRGKDHSHHGPGKDALKKHWPPDEPFVPTCGK